MPATPDRTTIRAALDAYVLALRNNLTVEPPTASKPFRRIAVGEAKLSEHPRPYLMVWLSKTRVVSAVSDDKLIELTLNLKAVTDATQNDSHGALLDAIGALDDYLDSLRDTGIIEGAEGFDLRSWMFEFPAQQAGARTCSASATDVVVVKVEREHNRLPAS